MIIFNWIALGEIILASILTAPFIMIYSYVIKLLRLDHAKDHYAALTIMGMSLIIIDLLWRLKKGEKRWFTPSSGGQVFYIAIWIWGIALFVGAIYFGIT